MRWTVWLRIPGDIVFAIGAATMFLFTARAIIAVFRFPIPTTKPELTATAHASGTES
jgi:nitric oxide reductase subunit B